MTPNDLNRPLSDVFGKSMNKIRLRPLYIEWASPCLEARPDFESYLKKFKKKGISTLAQFIEVFGKNHDP